jgi:hypothetical protein
MGSLASATVGATPTARLVYSRTADAESCPDEADLRQAVAARVGYDPFFAWAAKTIVAHTASARPQGFVVNIDLIDERGVAHGARELRTEGTCRELLDAAALAIAIAIDPQSLARSASKPVARETEDGVTLRPPDPAPANLVAPRGEPDVSDSKASHPLTLEGGGGLVASSGVGPAPAFGLALVGGIRGQRLSLGLDALVALPAGRPVQFGNLSSWAVLATLAPCAQIGPSQTCAIAQVGTLQASGSSSESHRSALWLAAGGRLGVLWPVEGSTMVRVRTDILGDLQRHAYWYGGVLAWTSPPVAFSFGLDVLAHF